jgi:hypothetical protein
MAPIYCFRPLGVGGWVGWAGQPTQYQTPSYTQADKGASRAGNRSRTVQRNSPPSAPPPRAARIRHMLPLPHTHTRYAVAVAVVDLDLESPVVD